MHEFDEDNSSTIHAPTGIPDIDAIGVENLQGPASLQLYEAIQAILLELKIRHDAGDMEANKAAIFVEDNAVAAWLSVENGTGKENPTYLKLELASIPGSNGESRMTFERPVFGKRSLFQISSVKVDGPNQRIIPENACISTVSQSTEHSFPISEQTGIDRLDLLDLLKRISEEDWFDEQIRIDARSARASEIKWIAKLQSRDVDLWSAERKIDEQDRQITNLNEEITDLNGEIQNTGRKLVRWKVRTALMSVLAAAGIVMGGIGITPHLSIDPTNSSRETPNDDANSETPETENIPPLLAVFRQNGIHGTFEPVDSKHKVPDGKPGWVTAVNQYEDRKKSRKTSEPLEEIKLSKPQQISISEGVLPASFADFDPRRKDVLIVMDEAGTIYRYHFMPNDKTDLPQVKYRTTWRDENIYLLLGENEIAFQYYVNKSGQIGSGLLLDLRSLEQNYPAQNPRLISEADYQATTNTPAERTSKSIPAETVIHQTTGMPLQNIAKEATSPNIR